MHDEENKNAYWIWFWNAEGKRLLERARRSWNQFMCNMRILRHAACMMKKIKMHTGFGFGKPKERVYLKELGEVGIMILKCILKYVGRIAQSV
jgi:hypothetical protein